MTNSWKLSSGNSGCAW